MWHQRGIMQCTREATMDTAAFNLTGTYTWQPLPDKRVALKGLASWTAQPHCLIFKFVSHLPQLKANYLTITVFFMFNKNKDNNIEKLLKRYSIYCSIGYKIKLKKKRKKEKVTVTQLEFLALHLCVFCTLGPLQSVFTTAIIDSKKTTVHWPNSFQKASYKLAFSFLSLHLKFYL